MSTRLRPRHSPKPDMSTSRLLFLVWCEAAEKWRQVRSDPAFAACVVARTNWYQHVWGAVPPIAYDWQDDWSAAL